MLRKLEGQLETDTRWSPTLPNTKKLTSSDEVEGIQEIENENGVWMNNDAKVGWTLTKRSVIAG
jgi:hypothetical protein